MKQLLLILFAVLCLTACEQTQSSQYTASLPVRTSSSSALPSPDITATPTLNAGPTPVSFSVTNAPQPSPSPTAFTPAPTVSPTADYPLHEGPGLNRDEIGVQVHIHREDQRQIFVYLNDLDVGWVKVQVSWKVYQPQPDVFAEDRLAELDSLVRLAALNDIQLLLSVSKAPEWSRPTTELDGPPTDYALYQEFMAFLAGRYSGRVAAYELWNEPNLQREWNGAQLSAAQLTRLIASGAAGIRGADSQAVIISGAPAPTGINDGITALDDRLFLRAMLEAGVADVVDGIGAHPYGWANPPDSRHTSPDPSISSHNDHPSFFFLDTIADYEALLAEFGVSQRLWVTEFGWGSFDQLTDDFGEPAHPPPGLEFMSEVTEWQQASYLLRALDLGRKNGSVETMIIWNLNFGPLLGHEYAETGYSLLRPDGTPRPAYHSLKSAKET